MPHTQPDNPRLGDVPAAFDAITERPSRDRYLSVHNGDANVAVVPYPEYSSRLDNDVGRDEHIQGVQRLGQHLLLSGGIKNQGERRSQILIAKLGSRTATGAWSIPYGHPNPDDPPRADALVEIFDVDQASTAHDRPILWHAGGIQLLGTILAVPLYGEDALGLGGTTRRHSEVRFYDCANLEDLGAVTSFVVPMATDADGAKAVGVARLADATYLALVWDDRALGFWRTSADSLDTGFHFTYAVDRDAIADFATGNNFFNSFTGAGDYQNMSLLTETATRRLYLLATRNTQKWSPTWPGHDLADLYAIDWPATGASTYDRPPTLRRVRQRKLRCKDQQCNFGAAAGTWVDANGRLFLYSAYHWLRGARDQRRRLHFNEYPPST